MKFDIAQYRDLYPFKSNFFVHSDSLKQHYIDEGEADETLVMVHGNPTWSFLYRDAVKEFSKDYRCIVPDHIGCGLSDKPSADVFPYKISEHVDRLEKLLDYANPKYPLTLVLHDWGAVIGMGYAVRHPERIKKLVIFNSAAFRLPAGRPFPWAIALFRFTELGPWLNNQFNAFSIIASYVCTLKGMDRRVREAFIGPYNSPANRVATTQFVLDVPLEPGDKSYKDLLHIENNLKLLKDKPTFICFGRRDVCFKKFFFDEWVKHFPDAETHSFQAGHYLLEDVSDEVFPLMRNFLESDSKRG
ncbi:MAG: alpha/beta fold hydrolase [Candidatus Riflebacteria bacterium]|nr:alpha/beta fold hydrolase [Candidatus Riflebacteria bacterium]